METQTQAVVKIDYKEFGLEEIKANQISDDFKPHFERIIELETEFEQVLKLDINDVMTPFKAKKLRQKYVKNRTLGFNETHKKGKDFFLNGGRFCDKIKNSGLAINELKEAKLLEIEKHYENQEALRISNLNNLRVAELALFEFNGSAMNLGLMDSVSYDTFYSGAKLQYEAKKAEEKRLALEAIEKENAEIRERKRIADENEKLKAEKEIADKVLSDQKAKADAELAKVEALRKMEQDKSDALLEKQRKDAKDKADKLKAESDLKLKTEREANDKLKAELQAKEDAERKAEATKQAELKAQQEAEKKAAKAPDKEKLNKWMDSLMIGITPNVGGDAHKVAINIQDKFSKFKDWANDQIKSI